MLQGNCRLGRQIYLRHIFSGFKLNNQTPNEVLENAKNRLFQYALRHLYVVNTAIAVNIAKYTLSKLSSNKKLTI